MTDLYLIRHAEAEGNVFRRLQGQYDSMITANGMRQIAALAARFRDIPVDAVYSSDLTRTCTTAGAICAPKRLPLHRERRLREIGCGVWENTPFAEFARRDPKSSYDFSHHPTTWRAEGSEPFAVYTGRFLQALREIAERHAGQTVALFSHGMVLRGSLQTLFFPEDENAVQHCENTAVTHVLYENGAFRLDYLNDDSHITPEISTVGRQKWWRGGDHNDFNMWYRDAAPGDAELLHALAIRPGSRRVRIALLHETPVGAAAFDGADGLLHDLALLPERRGRGLSPQLLGEAISLCRTAGARTLRLDRQPEDPAARALFAAYGFAGRPGVLDLQPKVVWPEL